MNERGHDLLPRAALPECVKRQLDHLPDKMAKRGKANIERDPKQAPDRRNYKLTVRNRSALVTTSTELMLMAALAIMGLSKRPSAG